VKIITCLLQAHCYNSRAHKRGFVWRSLIYAPPLRNTNRSTRTCREMLTRYHAERQTHFSESRRNIWKRIWQMSGLKNRSCLQDTWQNEWYTTPLQPSTQTSVVKNPGNRNATCDIYRDAVPNEIHNILIEVEQTIFKIGLGFRCRTANDNIEWPNSY